jgi:hypothetical protein
MDNVDNDPTGKKNAAYAEWKTSNDAKDKGQQDGRLYHQLPNEKDARLVGYAGDCKGCC